MIFHAGKNICVSALFILLSLPLKGQILEGLSSKFDNEISEWIIFAFDPILEEELEGSMSMRWPLDLDWTVWDFRLEDYTASVKVKWKSDPNHWEFRGNSTLQIKSVWQNDATNWIIIKDSNQYRFIARQTIDGLEWTLNSEDYGYFGMMMEYRGDIRDWFIVDELSEEIDIDMKMAMMFIPLIRHISQ